MHLRKLILTCILSATCVAGAQSVHAPAASMEPAAALNDMLGNLESELVPAVKAMPADKYNFAPTASTFAPSQGAEFTGVRTFAQQVAHLAQANYFFYSSVSGTKPTADVKAIVNLKTKDELVAALVASFAYAHQAIATITPDNAFLTIKGVDGMHTRVTVAAFAIAHGNDHYGQIVEYLRMNGIIPPASAK